MVKVATAIQKTVPVSVRAIGTVKAHSTVLVKTRVDGELTGVYFKEGDDVSEGQLLFRIDPRPFQATLDQAQSNLAMSTAQMKNAEAEASRAAALFQRGIVSREQNDLAQTTAQSAQSTVRGGEAAVENAALQLSFCEIRSPIDGRTGSLLVNAGNLVRANDLSPLVVINQVSPIDVEFSVAEQDLPAIRERMAAGRLAVQALAPNDGAEPVDGTVSFVDNAIDATTGTVKIKGTFENRQRRLWPGEFVDVDLTVSRERDAVVVPSQAIQTGEAGQFVFLVRSDMTVEARPVVSSRTYEADAVVEKGLQPGDTVVTDGQLRLAPGARVQIDKEGASPQSP